MDKKFIERNEFKNNILKQVIMRLDFQGVLPKELELILSTIKPFLVKKGFTRYDKRIENEIEIPMGMIQPDLNLSSPNIKNIEVHSFTDENKGYSIDLSVSFICLRINEIKYIPFEEYANVFMEIAEHYKNNIDFFSVKRFGLRKINFCFLKKLENLTKYFNDNYYSYNKLYNNTNNLISERRETFSVGDCKVNLLHGISQGQLDKIIMYKVVLDSDIYLDQQECIEQMIFFEKNINKLNDKLFEIYIDSITDKFKKLLKTEDFDFSSEIIGVEKNE